jgi:DNA repair protein RecO (recombination protein O)
MMQKTKGIVLHHIKYGDNGIIVYIFTRNMGRQTFIRQGIRQKKTAVKRNLFQPLFLLDLETYYRPGREMHRIKEAKIYKPYQNIPENIYKNTIVLFLAEILYKSLKTEDPNIPLFDFIEYSLETLDHLPTDFANFHLLFLYNLTRFLGFQPNLSGSGTEGYFDLREGIMRDHLPTHSFYLSKKYSKILTDLGNIQYENLDQFKISHPDRNTMTEHLLDYYQLHELNLTKIKSYKVLKEVFS